MKRRALHFIALLWCVGFVSTSVAEVQTSLSMTVPALVIGNTGAYSATQTTGTTGTSSGTVMHSYSGVMNFTQTSSTGRFTPFDGASRFGIGFDTMQIFQSFITPNYFTILNSGTSCPASGNYSWIMLRLRTTDAPRDAMSVSSAATNIGGTFSYTSGTSLFTGTNYFNLTGPTLTASPTYGISALSGVACASGANKGTRSGSSSWDPNWYIYYGARSIMMVSSHGNPEVVMAVPRAALTGTMATLSNFVFTGIYTYYQNATTQVQKNIYLVPNAAGTTFTLREVTSLTDPSQYNNLGTLTCTSLDSPTTSFCSGTLALAGVSGTGNAVCLVSQNSTENVIGCTAQYPGATSNPVTIVAKTVNQALLQVTVPATAVGVASIGNFTTLTATVRNLSSRHIPSIGNPSVVADRIAAPWSNTGSFGGGQGTCGTTLAAYSTCTFPVRYTANAIGAQSTTLRVLYNNGVTTPYATATLIGTTGLVSMAVTPAAGNQNIGTTGQLTATATYSNSSTQNVSSLVQWASSNTAAATVSTTGMATWAAAGSSTMSATLGATVGQRTYTVITPVILTAVSDASFPSSYLDQGSTYNMNFNNISGGSPGNDTQMTYACTFDRVVDDTVVSGTACTSLPGSATFNTSTGALAWTPNRSAWGPYELSVTGTRSSGGAATAVWVIDVRPAYLTTKLRGNYEAQFADSMGPNTTGDLFWQDLTTNNYDGTLSSGTAATWVGSGAYNSPYAVSLNGSAAVDFGSNLMSSQTRLMFTGWIAPTLGNSVNSVILGNSNNGAGNGFNLRQSASSSGKLDFSVGVEADYAITIGAHIPTAYYRLNEASGSSLADYSGNGYTLTVAGSGTTYAGTGAINGSSDTSIRFNGSGYACNSGSASLTGSFTVEAWVKPATLTGSLGIVGSRRPSDFSFNMKYNNGQFQGAIGNGTAWLAANANTTLSTYRVLNAWYHVVYVVTGTGYTIYVNGVNAGSGSYSSATPLLFNATHNLCVGADGSNFEIFNGSLDEVAIYSSALSSTDVTNHYNMGRTYMTTVVADSPLAYWRLGETSGATFADSTSTGYNMTASGSGHSYNQTGALAADTNGSLQVSGSGFMCRTSGATSLTGTFTVEAWVYPTASSGTFGIMGSRFSADSSFDMKYMNGQFHGDIGTGSAWLSTAADTPTNYSTLNTWYHVVYVVTPTGYTIYVNGVSAGNGSWASSTPVLFNSTHDLCIGSSASNNFEMFQGKIDEVAIYSTALTAQQVAKHYNSGLSSTSTMSCQSLTSMSNGVWNQVAGIYDGTNAILYVNGHQECSMVANGVLSSPASNVIAGATYNNTNYWLGRMAELQVYTSSDGSAAGTTADVNTNFTNTADMFRLTPAGNIVTSGIVMHMDAANATRGLAFPGSGIAQTTWFDLSANNNEGALNSMTGISTSGWVGAGTGASPYALAFDGTNDSVTTSYLQNAVTAYSVEVWVKTTDAGAQKVFVHNRGAGSGKSLTLGIGTTGGGHGGAGRIGFELDSDGIDIGISTNTAYNDGVWHHVVGTWAATSGTAVATSQFRIYVDGALATTAGTATGSANSPLTGLGGTTIGYHAPWATYFSGSLAKVAIYNRQLSLAEVQQNCRAIVSRFTGAVCN